MKKLLLLAATAATTLSLSAQTVLYDFEDTNTLTNDFTFDQTGSGTFQQVNSGLSNSGRLRAPTSNQDFAIVTTTPATFDTSSDFSFTQSVFFKTTASAGNEPDDEPVILGITDQASQAAPGNYALMQNNFVNVAMRTNSVVNSFPPPQTDFGFVFLGSSANNSFTGQSNDSGQMAADSWYLLTATYNYVNASDEWSIDREVFSVDSDGLNQSSIVGNSFTLNNPFGQNQEISLYGFLAGDSGEAGSIEAFDNATLLSGVPEPSSYSLIAGALALAVIATRRRLV